MWIERGGVFAVSTLRGGSEYGERWHKSGMLLNKQNVFDDFISSGEWLIDNNYTNPDLLGIQGGSNGGLLVAAATTQRPELFGAVLCGFPDLDILRFPWYIRNNNAPALLEYGNSKNYDEFLAIKEYSPYQNIKKGVPYPAIMLFTGALDTRVPPLAARKSAAKFQSSTISDKPIILRYHQKAGHAVGRGLSFSQGIKDRTMEFVFMAQELGLKN
jgi:Serine proteases of the peptidase family S9A